MNEEKMYTRMREAETIGDYSRQAELLRSDFTLRGIISRIEGIRELRSIIKILNAHQNGEAFPN